MSVPRIEVNTKDNSVTVRLRDVRLSFPALFTPRSFDEKSEPGFQATFLFPKGDENQKLMEQGINHVIKTAFKGRHPGADRVCMRDGAVKADRGIDGYSDEIMFVSSNSKKRVPVVDRDLFPVEDVDNKVYAGCYVNATVRLWAQDNKFGRRVNAQLRAVQYHRDGEPFGDSGANPEQEFEPSEEAGSEAL